MDDDLTPTQKIWLPISQLDHQHDQAFRDLHTAIMIKGDLGAAELAKARIAAIEQEQAEAHSAARQYILRKLQVRNSIQDAPFRPETGVNFNGRA